MLGFKSLMHQTCMPCYKYRIFSFCSNGGRVIQEGTNYNKIRRVPQSNSTESSKLLNTFELKIIFLQWKEKNNLNIKSLKLFPYMIILLLGFMAWFLFHKLTRRIPNLSGWDTSLKQFLGSKVSHRRTQHNDPGQHLHQDHLILSPMHWPSGNLWSGVLFLRGEW